MSTGHAFDASLWSADDNELIQFSYSFLTGSGSSSGAMHLPEISSGLTVSNTDYVLAVMTQSHTVTSSSAASTGATTTSTTGAPPSWIATLHDTAIKADMTAASAGGTVSETGMAKLFTDLAAELTTSKTTLSVSQLSDLKTIAADLNVGETASSYVTYIADALILGNAANATWTGGGANPTTLGNLAAGSTATQLSELTGKWFLGTDLPNDVVSMSGDKAFTVSYSAKSTPLYGSSGPSINDVNQGNLGDCYLLSSLAEVAYQNPSLITSMITANGGNTYGVCFVVNGVTEYVTVSNTLANGGNIFNSGPAVWASLVEQAYAELQVGGVVTGNSVNAGNSWTTIGNGGGPEYALAEITGATKIIDFCAAGNSSWNEYASGNAIALQSYAPGLSTSSVFSTLIADLAAKDDVILSSNTNAYDSHGMQTLVADHAMSIYGYDRATGLLEVFNPWGTESGQSWDTTFEVSLSTLLSAGDTITVDNAGTAGNAGNSVNDSITKLYIGYYDRAPDPAGETYWAGQLQGGMSLSAIAQSYSVQTESTALYQFLASPNTASTAAVQAFLVAVYANLFNRAPDAAGEAYWVSQIQTGASMVGGAIINIISGATSNDLLTINNKVTVSDYYDTQIYSHSVAFSNSVALAALNAVTSNTSSIATAEAIVNAYVATAPLASQSATASQAEVNLVGVSPSHDLASAA